MLVTGDPGLHLTRLHSRGKSVAGLFLLNHSVLKPLRGPSKEAPAAGWGQGATGPRVRTSMWGRGGAARAGRKESHAGKRLARGGSGAHARGRGCQGLRRVKRACTRARGTAATGDSFTKSMYKDRTALLLMTGEGNYTYRKGENWHDPCGACEHAHTYLRAHARTRTHAHFL